MLISEQLQKEMFEGGRPEGVCFPDYFRAQGYKNSTHTTPSGKRADGIAGIFCLSKPYIHKHDLIAGSIRPMFAVLTQEEIDEARSICAEFPERSFVTNSDHYTADYETLLTRGVDGMLADIAASEAAHADDPARLDFLDSMRITLNAFSARIRAYGDHAQSLIDAKADGYDADRLAFVRDNCYAVAGGVPVTFAQGLQLVWMLHTAFVSENRYAMALGRLDQYLYPLYKQDIAKGMLTRERALDLVQNVLVKICEKRPYLGGDDVVNIAIAGVDENGVNATNDLSFIVLEAVGNINLPGPNLSARIAPDTPDAFLDAALKVIGTGLGYPALMNDTVNMAALRRYGYEEKDIRNYTMVGCIENFITGCQPPWSDGRYDAPRFLEYVLHNGVGLDPNMRGLETGPVSEITSMEALMAKLELQMAHGAKVYVENFNRCNDLPNPAYYTQPFLSCFCRCCIERGLDINMGGAKYPSVHGAALMGVGTMCDSLAAIEKVVFCDREATLDQVARATACNFVGHEDLQRKLLAAPKYGNNDDFADKYAVWFVDFLNNEFDKYKTRDGGGFYTAMAANTSNIWAGKGIGATPDGRLAQEPLSDAASPTYGRDTSGVTQTILSLSKPDYTRVACGTVVNQKFSPSMFEDGKRAKLAALIRAYFARGGQEMQINATSTEILRDAIDHPENYGNLVVRVSGFSALYVLLDRDVQNDILHRTQHEE